MEYNSNLEALFIIINAGFADEVIGLARSTGVRGATIINARGEGAQHESFMGITVDSEKEIILCIVDKQTSAKTMETLKENAGIKTPAHSVCFTMPVDKMIGIGLTPEKA